MFSYVDKSIREDLESDRLLVTLDRDSVVVTSNDPSAFISILGPVPIPRLIGSQEVALDWYPFVRRTELSHVLDAARDVIDGASTAFRDLLQSSMSPHYLELKDGTEIQFVRFGHCKKDSANQAIYTHK